MSASKQLPDEAKLLTRVVVGSRLHGLHNADSDTDYRGVFIHDTEKLLSPFTKLSDTHWLEGGDEDDTAYELRYFIKMCANGNPTAIEVLYSDKIVFDTWAFNILRRHRHLLLNSKAIYEAHMGYAKNQLNKMNMFTPDARTPKFAVAYVRSLVQGIQLLETGDFKPTIKDYNPFLHDKLMQIKYAKEVDVMEYSAIFEAYANMLTEAYKKNMYRFYVDEPWLEDFINAIYVEKHGHTTRIKNGYTPDETK